MNRNRKTKVLAVTLSAGMIVTGTPLAANASPLAGAVASMYSISEAVIEESSPLSGTSLALSNIMAKASVGISGMSTVDSGSMAAPADAGAADPFSNIGISTASDFVYIREAADPEASILGKFYGNCYSEVIETVGEWVHIRSGSVDGYVSADYIRVGDEDLILAVSRRVARVNADMLNVREGMDTESRVLGRFPTNTVLDVVDESMVPEGWVMVGIDEGEGFVSADYVVLDREYIGVAESLEEEAARIAAEKALKEAEAAARAAATQKSQSSVNTSSGNSQAPAAPSAPAAPRTYNAPAGMDGNSVASYALQFVGNPYVYGGSSLTNGTDCSGFVMSVYNQFGVGLPHSSSSLRSSGYGVSYDEAQPGDIVCYSGHVGIYIGGGQIVHASNRRDGIKVSNAGYRSILGVRRIF